MYPSPIALIETPLEGVAHRRQRQDILYLPAAGEPGRRRRAGRPSRCTVLGRIPCRSQLHRSGRASGPRACYWCASIARRRAGRGVCDGSLGRGGKREEGGGEWECRRRGIRCGSSAEAVVHARAILVIACAEAMADAWHPAGNNVRLFIRHCTTFGCD